MRISNKVFYISAIALLAVTLSGLYLMSDSTIVSAQKGNTASRGGIKGKVATEDMLNFALRLGTADSYTVFGAKGVRGEGAIVEGKKGTGLDEASLGEEGSGLKARSDINKALSYIKQLPCRDIGAALTGGSFEPGVYCAPSAALAGQMTLSGSGRFVFLIDGAMKSADNFQMNLENGAKAADVFFVADSASLSAWGTISGSVIARGTVDVGAGTKINGRAVSKDAEVILASGANLVLDHRTVQICKFALYDGLARTTPGSPGFYAQDTSAQNTDLDLAYPVADSLRNRIFRFSINGAPLIQVPVGECSAPIPVPDGAVTIQEAIDGYYTHLPQTADNTWFNRFRLVNVGSRTTDGSTSPTITTNFTTRTASFTIPVADPNAPGAGPIIVEFTNTFAIPAVIEICKYPANLITTSTGGATPVDITDTDPSEVSGYFEFTVNVVPDTTYSIPANSCTGPIQLLVPTTPQPTPTVPAATGQVYVTELAEAGFTLETMRVFGGNGENRLAGGLVFNELILNTQASGCFLSNRPGFLDPPPSGPCRRTGNDGGGWVGGTVYENANAANQTIFQFYNRVNPGVIKVCKIAGRGVPIGTRFEFVVQGRQAEFQATGSGNLILPGQDIERTVVIPAGPADQGGFCEIVSEDPDGRGPLTTGGADTLFINGTLALVTETAVLDDVPGAQEGGFGDVPTVTFFGTAGYVSPGNASPRAGQAASNLANPPGYGGIVYQVPAGLTIGGLNTLSTDFKALLGTAGCFGGAPRFVVQTNNGYFFVYIGTPPGYTCPADNIYYNTGNLLGPGAFVDSSTGYGGTFYDPYTTFQAAHAGDVITDIYLVVDGGWGGGGPQDFHFDNTQINSALYTYEPQALPAGLLSPTSPATEVRVSRISVNGVVGTNIPTNVAATVQGTTLGPNAANPANQDDPNPDLFSPADSDGERRVIFRVGRGETVVTFVNRVFSPTQLKICKVAGTGIAIGTPFTFNITIDSEGGLVPGQTNEPITVAPITIPAGDPALSAQGNCVIVNGPYEAPAAGDPSGVIPAPPISFGTFDVGSAVTVSETGSPSSVVITSPTGPAANLTVDAANRRATLIMGYPGGFNELIFVNSAAAPVSTGYSLAGRVMTPDGGGLRNAQVILTKPDGTRMTVPTSSMGYYSFSGLANETYTVSVSSRRYRFTARNVDLNASLANVDFNGIE